MERFAELEEYIHEYRSERMKLKNQNLMADYAGLTTSFGACLDSLFERRTMIQECEEQYRIKYILFFRLLTSGYTDSYEIAVGMSSEKLYLDDKLTFIFWKPKAVYDGISKDMEEVKRRLVQKYVRIEEYELLHLKQKLLLDDWKLFCKMIKKLEITIMEKVLNSPLLLEDEIQILYGNYMDRLEEIGRIKIEGRNGNG